MQVQIAGVGGLSEWSFAEKAKAEREQRNLYVQVDGKGKRTASKGVRGCRYLCSVQVSPALDMCNRKWLNEVQHV